MDASRIVTESPKEEQWRLLSQYAYPTNIEKFLSVHGHQSVIPATVEYIAGSIQQGRAYYNAAENAPLDIRPLLLYYGSATLLAGAAAMMIGMQLDIHEHGMKIRQSVPSLIADVEIVPINFAHGGLQLLSNVFSNACLFVNRGAWTIGEIFASIPDVRLEYLNQYKDIPYTIPIETVAQQGGSLERFEPSEVERFASVEDVLGRIEGLSQSYLRPQHDPQMTHVILNRRSVGPDIGTYSMSGRKYLQIAHQKNGQMLNPNQLILMLMGLFALGYLSRYHPERWNPFVRSDVTGERLVIEKFLDVCARYFPNLVLNGLNGAAIQFVYEIDGARNTRSSLAESDVRRIVSEMRRAGELT